MSDMSRDHMPIGDVIRAVTADFRQGCAAIRVDQLALLARIEAAERRQAERDELRAVAHNATIAAPVPAVAPPTAGTHPDSPETSESRTAPLPPPVAYGITVIEQRCTLCGRTDIDHTPGKVSLAEKETP